MTTGAEERRNAEKGKKRKEIEMREHEEKMVMDEQRIVREKKQ